MKDVEEGDIFSFYLPMVVIALGIQLLLATFILWLNKDTLAFTIWSDSENRSFFNGTRDRADVQLMSIQAHLQWQLSNRLIVRLRTLKLKSSMLICTRR